jgi:hypothetical protein
MLKKLVPYVCRAFLSAKLADDLERAEKEQIE